MNLNANQSPDSICPAHEWRKIVFRFKILTVKLKWIGLIGFSISHCCVLSSAAKHLKSQWKSNLFVFQRSSPRAVFRCVSLVCVSSSKMKFEMTRFKCRSSNMRILHNSSQKMLRIQFLLSLPCLPQQLLRWSATKCQFVIFFLSFGLTSFSPGSFIKLENVSVIHKSKIWDSKIKLRRAVYIRKKRIYRHQTLISITLDWRRRFTRYNRHLVWKIRGFSILLLFRLDCQSRSQSLMCNL